MRYLTASPLSGSVCGSASSHTIQHDAPLRASSSVARPRSTARGSSVPRRKPLACGQRRAGCPARSTWGTAAPFARRCPPARDGRQPDHLEPRSPRSRSRWACAARRTRASVRSCLRPHRRPPARSRNAASDCPPPADRYPCASSQGQLRGYACRSWLLPCLVEGGEVRVPRADVIGQVVRDRATVGVVAALLGEREHVAPLPRLGLPLGLLGSKPVAHQ